MRESEFREFLLSSDTIESKTKAINSRISKSYLAEEIVGVDFDSIVKDDDKMYEALLKLKSHPQEHNGCLQNTLRWYYKFVNEKAFPRLSSYK